MRIALLLTALVSAAVLAAPDDNRPITVQLKNGKRIRGRVLQEQCTEELLVIRELRTQAKRSIKWSEIKDDNALQLRVKLGFEVAATKGGLQIQGHEIIAKSGAVFVGLLINAKTAQRDGMYILKRFDGERRIRLNDVRSGPTEIDINALEVYKPIELYEQKLKEKTPETAEDHFKLAEFASAMGALEPARRHYQKVLEIGGKKYTEAMINRRIVRIDKRLANKEADDALREIKKSTWQNKFGKAGQLVVAFKEQYKDDEDLIKEVTKLEADLKERRQSYFITKIPRMVRKTVKDLFAKKVKEKDLTLRMATNYAGGESSDEISASHEALKLISEKLGVEPTEVLDFWKLRNKRPVYKAFYRDGTFIVVENLQDALAKAPKLPSGKSQIKPPKPHPIKTPDGWWNGKMKARKHSQLRDWLYAWWADKSGMVDLMQPKEELCPTCTGKGFTVAMHQTSQGAIPYYDRCQTCYMAKNYRVVRFK